MVERVPFLVGIDDFFDARACPMPDCVFRIGEGGHANIGQFPNLRAMAFYVIGKAPVPMPDGVVDWLGMGPFALGGLIGDASLKLVRPWPTTAAEWVGLMQQGPDGSEISTIIDAMLPLSPKASSVRSAFLYRVGEFMDVALHRPERLPAIIAALDALTSERLTERARAIMQTGIDPGAADLWPDAVNGWVG